MREACRQAEEIYIGARKQGLSLMQENKAKKARRALKFLEIKKESSYKLEKT